MHFLDRIADLPPEKRALLSRKLNPMSFAQQRLWFLDQLDPGRSTYNLFTGYRLSGPLDKTALQRSLSEIVRRHEVLRTNFAMIEGQLVQILNPACPIELPLVDLTGEPESEKESRLLELANTEAQRPFDLARGPMLRATLVKLAEEEHVSLLSVHHIVFDGWSMNIFLQEMAVLYDAFSRGAPSPLRDLPLQYGDFARWQRQTLQGARLEKILSYWKEQLRGAPPLLELPTDRPRATMQSFAGNQTHLELSPDLSDALRAMSRQEDVTLFMLLLAAFKVLLSRYSGQENIVVATPVAGRDRSEIESLIGFFVNTLVLHTDLSGNPTFREALKRVREVALGAYSHQELPFEKLVDEIRPERDTSQNPLFQVMFLLQNISARTMEAPEVKSAGLTMTRIDVDPVSSKFDLTLGFIDRAEDLVLWFEYNTDLFDASTIEKMMTHYVRVLEAIVSNPQIKVSQIPLLTDAEWRHVVEDFNQTATEVSDNRSIPQIFESQARRSPEAVAVTFEQQQLTFEELDERTNQVAQFLQSVNVGPGVPVALCLDRSLEMVVGIMGVLKAGGAYVPIDPSYPVDRIAFILNDAHARVLLTEQKLAERFTAYDGHVVSLDSDWSRIAEFTAEPVATTVGPENLAYVLYTSGSTGTPKGVMISHRAIGNHMRWLQRRFPLDHSDSVLQKTPFTFDASVWEFLAPLMSGARLVVAPPDVHRDPAAMIEILKTNEITILQVVPSLLRALTMEPGLSECTSLRRLFCGGEALTKEVVERFQTKLPAEVVNLYGPTETAIDASFYCCSQTLPDAIPIGTPVDNTCLYVLDSALNPLPAGVPGELFIGGAQLAEGYVNRPALTAERFLPDPFSHSPGARLYRTRDLVRYREHGGLEYLGRVDRQVKIRGYRIEPGEVESVILAHESVAGAIVIASDDERAAKRLVAYVVFKDNVATDRLRDYLRTKLPDYMVPSLFVPVSSIPLTTNGKVDLAALPAATAENQISGREYVPPHTLVEEMLCDIWADVLGVERVGINDNFFDLGGDSILSIQVVWRASEKGYRVTPKQMFLSQTIAELAPAVTRTIESKAEQGIVTGPVPLTPIQHIFFDLEFSEPHYYHQSGLLRLHQRWSASAVESATRRLIEHHDALRLRFNKNGAGWKQFNAGMEGDAPFTSIDLSELTQDQQSRTIEKIVAQLEKSLDLSQGPLMRIALFELGEEQDQRLSIIFHHLAIDGVSWRIVIEDMQTALDQAARGEPIVLPRKTTSFKEWAGKLNQYAQSAELKEEARFWRTVKSASLKRLPLDYPFADNTEASAATLPVQLSKEETRALLRDVPAAFHTEINDVLLTALVHSLSTWTGARKVLVDLEGHGREEIVPEVDLSRTVGWFTTIFPVLIDASDVTNIQQLLTTVKQQLRTVPNKGIGYGVLRYMSDDVAFKSLPQADVALNYLGQFGPSISQSTVFSSAPEAAGTIRSAKGGRTHILKINGGIADDQLNLGWNYSQNLHRPSTIEQMAECYWESLRLIIEQARVKRELKK